MTRTTHVGEGDKHSSDINTLLFHKGKLYSGADDGKIKVWDDGLKLVGEIPDAHSKSVFALAANDDTLYSGSNDGTIKSWSLNDLKAKSTLAKGPREILKLVYDNDTLYAGDNKGIVELYAKEKLVTDVNIHDPVKDMLAVDNLLYTLQELDIVIRLIRSKFGNFERRKTIMGGTPMCIAGNKLLFCSRDGQDIHLRENSIDLNFKDISLMQEAHDQRIHAMLGMTRDNDTFLYSGGGDKVVKQWKIDGKCLVKLNHCSLKTGVNTMTAGRGGEIYAGCRDGYLFRLDF